MYIFLVAAQSIITGAALLAADFAANKLCKINKMKENGKTQLACAHNFPERRTCRKWQLLAFDCFTDDVNDVSNRSPVAARRHTETLTRTLVLTAAKNADICTCFICTYIFEVRAGQRHCSGTANSI